MHDDASAPRPLRARDSRTLRDTIPQLLHRCGSLAVPDVPKQ